MQSIHLDGAEQVRSAGHTISSAADQMSRAASSMQDAAQTIACAINNLHDILHMHHAHMDEWISRLENALERKDPA